MDFITDCEKEIKELENKKIFKKVDIPEGVTTKDLLSLMWVFKYKSDFDGYITKYKSRLVARGDLQSTEKEIYAAIVVIQTFRAIMAISAAFDLEIRFFDVMNAYINAELVNPIRCQ